ncbi:TetR/AcrR family transcriptional regulator [Streptomyces sp. B6B3]|uniref:TetR/AcrR family transcriptional regulator n=1 Tax=Streptomyces sp. B6B3 TaxID=3153570 RepID=UPI00325D2707
MPEERSYHHGDLRRAVLDAALDVIATQGVAAVSLRDLARRAGVSHAAPAHHFGDRTGLLTAIATEGHGLLADALAGADLREMGVRYVRFALDHPAHFEVMSRTDLQHRDDPDLVAARDRAAARLRAGLDDLPAVRHGDADPELAALAAWSLAHGFAALHLAGRVPERPDHDPEEIFRALTGFLFR